MLPTLATIAAIAVFVAAGNWQRGRMDDKAALRAQLDAALAAPVAALPATDVDWSAWRYRSVDVEGNYDAARQILIDNKVHAGRTGFHVVTPLDLADGRAVLVDRGFVAAGATRADLPAVPPPAGTVHVRGRINIPGAYVELSAASAGGRRMAERRPGAVRGGHRQASVADRDRAGCARRAGGRAGS
jgi:surfeit locus 1 family protein